MKKLVLFFMIFIGIFSLNIYSEASTKPISGGKVDTNGTNLNVRSNASTTSSIKAKVKHNSYLTIYSTNGNFYYVEYKDGYFGYVHKNYVDVVSTNVKKYLLKVEILMLEKVLQQIITPLIRLSITIM